MHAHTIHDVCGKCVFFRFESPEVDDEDEDMEFAVPPDFCLLSSGCESVRSFTFKLFNFFSSSRLFLWLSARLLGGVGTGAFGGATTTCSPSVGFLSRRVIVICNVFVSCSGIGVLLALSCGGMSEATISCGAIGALLVFGGRVAIAGDLRSNKPRSMNLRCIGAAFQKRDLES